MPRSAAHLTTVSLSLSIPHASLPSAVVAVPDRAVGLDGDAEARVPLLAPQVRAFRANDLVVALPVVP